MKKMQSQPCNIEKKQLAREGEIYMNLGPYQYAYSLKYKGKLRKSLCFKMLFIQPSG
jgi:hypothetical protein